MNCEGLNIFSIVCGKIYFGNRSALQPMVTVSDKVKKNGQRLTNCRHISCIHLFIT